MGVEIGLTGLDIGLDIGLEYRSRCARAIMCESSVPGRCAMCGACVSCKRARCGGGTCSGVCDDVPSCQTRCGQLWPQNYRCCGTRCSYVGCGPVRIRTKLPAPSPTEVLHESQNYPRRSCGAYGTLCIECAVLSEAKP